MAKKSKKKLNIRVALIGIAVLGVIVMAGGMLYLRMTRNPEKHYERAVAAMESQDYDVARDAYGKAYAYSKSKEKKIELLYTMADLALLDVPADAQSGTEAKEADWPRAIQCWKNITVLDPSDIESRRKLLDFYYTMADFGQESLWKQVGDTSKEIIDTQEKNNQPISPSVEKKRAWSLIRQVQTGDVPDRELYLEEARGRLEKLIESNPEDMDLYKYMANLEIEQGKLDEASGKLNALANSRQAALDVLDAAIEAYPENVQAYINRLDMKFSLIQGNIEGYKRLSAEYDDLVEKFPQSPEAHFNTAFYYQLDLRTIDKAKDHIDKAMSLSPDNVEYIKQATFIYYKKSRLDKDPELLEEAIRLAIKGLGLPESQDVVGPYEARNRTNKYTFSSYLSKYYIEIAVEAREQDDEQKAARYLELAQKYINNIEQILPVADNPVNIKWRGFVELAKGNRDEAIRNLYDAYQKTSVTENPDVDVAYALARLFIDTQYVGATSQFLSEAIKAHVVQNGKPDAVLDYAQVLIRLGAPGDVLSVLEDYEGVFGSGHEKFNRIKIQACIAGGFFEDAAKILDSADFDKVTAKRYELALISAQVNALVKQAQIDEEGAIDDETLRKSLERVDQILVDILREGEDVDLNVVTALVNYYFRNDMDKARTLLNTYLEYNPESIDALVMLGRSELDNPINPTPEELEDVFAQSVEKIDGDIDKAMAWAQYYQSRGMDQEVIDVLMPFLDDAGERKGAIAGIIFDTATKMDNLELAQQMTDLARQENFDRAGGDFFAAQLALKKKDYNDALRRIDSVLAKRPIFPVAYVTRSLAKSALEDYQGSVEDAQTAYRQNPLNTEAARHLALVLVQRNDRLGQIVTQNQKEEAERALVNAIRLNPNNTQLQGLYAHIAFEDKPFEAFNIRKKLYEADPSAQNAETVADMAVLIARQETDSQTVSSMLEYAEKVYKDAVDRYPDNVGLLDKYAQLLQTTGRSNEAEEILGGNEKIMWKVYLRQEKFTQAKEILDKLYAIDPTNPEILEGLINVAKHENNQADVIKYTDEIIAVNKNQDTRLMQIQAFLDIGMLDEAETKLNAYKQEYPDEQRGRLLEVLMLLRRGDFNSAFSAISMAVDTNRDNPLAWRIKAQIETLMGDYNQAVSSLVRSKTLNADVRASVELARAYARADRVSQAINELRSLIQASSVPDSVYMVLEELYVKQGSDSELMNYYREMIEKFPESNFWSNRLAQSLLRTGKPQQALEIYKANWQDSEEKDVTAFQGYLNSLIGLEDYNAVIELTDKYADGPLASICNAYSAEAKFKSGNEAAAFEDYADAVESAAGDENITNQLISMIARVASKDGLERFYKQYIENSEAFAQNVFKYNYLRVNGRLKDSVEALDKCIELAAGNEAAVVNLKATKASTIQMLMREEHSQEYFDEAVEIYEELLDRTPNNASLLNNYAYLLAGNESTREKSLEIAKKAYALAPTVGTILDTYGYALLKNGQNRKALQMFIQAIQMVEADTTNVSPELYEHLGEANAALEQNEEAIAAYQRALDLGRNYYNESQREAIEQTLRKLNNP
ncbi:tetratricopeptide repeat protein [Limihaloglobus sulfuriphilus]|uniref:Tetratricopeptide repeat protein n=1 Tax=Limihaloglobus sulfuriphilus TaxID=1851148 RepID=A0A1Q2MGT6_9BACT|nr:tetratricopeptide repeat protein [Limihaloglobus sulfuriphilus]AQQ71915.1 tetratricopeptide repeat protein [Limihaloglobus sulfuriphilus]